MAVRYHINPETGAVNICQANIQCKFASSLGNEPQHFEDKQIAVKSAEVMLEAKYRGLSSDFISQGYKNHVYDDGYHGYPHYSSDESPMLSPAYASSLRQGDYVIIEDVVDLYDKDGQWDDDEKFYSAPVKVKKLLSGGKSLLEVNGTEVVEDNHKLYYSRVMMQPQTQEELSTFNGTWMTVSRAKDKKKIAEVLGDNYVSVVKKDGDKTAFVPIPNGFLKDIAALEDTSMKPAKNFTYKTDMPKV